MFIGGIRLSALRKRKCNKIVFLLVDPETGKVLRSAETHPRGWLEVNRVYDEVQRLLGARRTREFLGEELRDAPDPIS